MDDDIIALAGSPSTGDKVLGWYRYQFLYTILLAIQMHQKIIPFERIFCELAEDVLGILPNKKFVGIQIKTKEKSDEKLTFNDEKVVSSLCKFIELNEKYKNGFEGFVFVTNTDFTPSKNLQKLLNDIKNNQKLDKNQEQLIKKLSNLAAVDTSKVIDVLKITGYQKGPSLDAIESKIIHEYLPKIPNCSSLIVSQLEIVLKNLIGEVGKRSSRKIDGSLSDYVSFVVNGGKKQIIQEIKAKEITPQFIEQISNSVQSTYLKSNIVSELGLKKGSVKTLRKKMEMGGIHEMEINSMKALSYAASVYFFEEYNKRNGQSEEIKNQINQLQLLLTNEASEAKTETQMRNKTYGQQMLKVIEQRLKKIVETRHMDVYFIKYEILKGVVGMLTSDCSIWFSNNKRGKLR